MEVNKNHLIYCLEQYQKGELTGEQVNDSLTTDEKLFLTMQQNFLQIAEEDKKDFDILDWLDEEGAFFMVVEVDERLCREAESVLEELRIGN